MLNTQKIISLYFLLISLSVTLNATLILSSLRVNVCVACVPQMEPRASY